MKTTASLLLENRQYNSHRKRVVCQAKYRENIPRCVYCNLVQRKEILMKERGCLKCLAPGHIASSCQNEKVCRHCKQRGHHQSICPTLSACDSSEKKRHQPEGYITNTTTTNTVRNKGTVLLQTAKGIAFNGWSHVRIFFRVGQEFWVHGIQGLFKSSIRYIAA